MANRQFEFGRPAALRGNGDRAVVADGDWVEIDRISKRDLLAQADAAFRSYLQVYEDRCVDLQPPSSGDLSVEDLVACGLGRRMVELSIGDVAEHSDLLLPGQRFEIKTQSKDARLLGKSLSRSALSRVLVNACLTWQPQYVSITGRFGADFIYLYAAALPLRGKQGEIADVLLPFVSKLGNIPARLRQEFFTRHVEHP